MIISFLHKKTFKERMKDRLLKIHERILKSLHDLPSGGYCAYFLRMKSGKLLRVSKYKLEDLSFSMKRYVRYTETILFGALVVLALLMLYGSGGESFLTTLIALLMIALIVVVYSQVKMQRRMIRQYVPTIDLVRIRKCRLYSDRLRVRNLFAAAEKVQVIKMIRNVIIAYDIINDSFSPISVDSARLLIKIKKGEVKSLKPSIAVLDVQPKRTSGSEVSFRLGKPINFDDIEWVELELKGNAKKKVRIRPHLFVNVMIRGNDPQFIKESFARFVKRPEVREMLHPKKDVPLTIRDIQDSN